MSQFCTHCGVRHTASDYPKLCQGCRQITFINPTPVAVLLVPVRERNGRKKGLLIGRRNIEPKKGEFALIGGFVDMQDASVEHAAARELFEETCITIDPQRIKPVSSYNTGRNMLVFCRSEVIDEYDLDVFQPNKECVGIKVAWDPEELAFPSHTEVMAKWFVTKDI